MFNNNESRAARIKNKVVAGGKAISAKIKDTVGDASKKIVNRAMKDAIRGAVREANQMVDEQEKKEKKA